MTRQVGSGSEINTVIGSNVVWDLYVVIGNTKISLGPAQFICKARVFFQKQSLHDIIFCFDFLSCRFGLFKVFFQDKQNGDLSDDIIFENSEKVDLYLLMGSKLRTS